MNINDAAASETADAIYNAAYFPLWGTSYWDTSARDNMSISTEERVKQSTMLLLFENTFEPTMNITYMSLKDAI